ncbi:hypothetical protein SAMN05444920_1404 [Nonomuraea solani]|uniref:DUF2255 family protein n=1 Tax=Nonomuraea solani TaxID=1144553 RepID=A0A1H6F0C3_9ACTN|nr:DUF2255 family protein [Nonomuraea solani]SEH03590.1 hypothetical protein SAMN05444920_1404 [Nonomuraea solani]
MATWTGEELSTIGYAEELDLSSQRDDGTLGRPVTIWVVRVADDLYVRCMNGRSGAWYRGARVRHQGHISAGGVEADVAFAHLDPADAAVHDQIDEVYRTKYRRFGGNIIGGVVNPDARAATIKLIPER